MRHEILNEGDEPRVMLWVVCRLRRPGEPPPPPFARPADVVATERALGLNDT